MAGMTFDAVAKHRPHGTSSPQSRVLFPANHASQQSLRGNGNASPSPLGSLSDPLVQDINHASRRYLFYFASDVCRDLVLYDIPKYNPFRELIPLTHRYPVLLQIIIANSALHMSNACQKPLILDTIAFPVCHRTSLPGSPRSSSSVVQQPGFYHDALAAKQQALYLLKSALNTIATADTDVILAVVLLFVEFELLDTGRDNWRHHINGARTIIETLYGSNISMQGAMSPLRSLSSDTFASGAISLLQDAQGNHCSSFPADLLQLIRTGAQLSQNNHPTSPPYSLTCSSKQQQALILLSTAQSFHPLTWAQNVQPRFPTTDLQHRTHIASAHRAAVCIYLSRVSLSLNPTTTQVFHDLEPLVANIITDLSFLRPNDALFKATAWPAFIAGAETTDPSNQEWVARRFQELWEVEPWGMIKGALGVLGRIWAGRNNGAVVNGGEAMKEERRDGDWIRALRGRGVDWLIL
ncbi:MAG: hypothetical protein Q9160_005064 [Pyrenula sp. 1 TL-2023]